MRAFVLGDNRSWGEGIAPLFKSKFPTSSRRRLLSFLFVKSRLIKQPCHSKHKAQDDGTIAKIILAQAVPDEIPCGVPIVITVEEE
jgi:hypothetical protein